MAVAVAAVVVVVASTSITNTTRVTHITTIHNFNATIPTKSSNTSIPWMAMGLGNLPCLVPSMENMTFSKDRLSSITTHNTNLILCNLQ